MNLPRFANTATFKLALIYALIFGWSALILFFFLYWSITSYVFEQMRSSIDTETAVLLDDAQNGGVADLSKEVDERASRAESSSSYYLLQGPTGSRLAGNLEPLAKREGIFEENVRPLGAKANLPATSVLFRGSILPDGHFLAIGRDLIDVTEIDALILRSFLAALAASAALAVLGGVLLSRQFLRRIEAINRTTDTIIRGELSQRIAVRGTGDELDRLGANLNRMLDRIQALMESMQQVSSDIAHDLRTPLARLRNRLERVRRPGSTLVDYERELEAAIGETDDILSTFAALLRIAQIEAGSRSAGFKPVCLSEVFATIVEAYSPVAEDRQQRLVASVAQGILIQGDADLLTQMLANLVENALRHSEPRSTVTVRLLEQVAGPTGTVSDDGPGIPESEREKVFRRFYRLERSRTTPGSGLGLSLVAAVAEMHGIRIAIAGNDPGTRVELDFPPYEAAGAS